jgi:tRNA 2-selenouridine synthase
VYKRAFAYEGEIMYKTLEYKDIKEGCILIDVRSPQEFEEATIPKAINIPLFTNEERQLIGNTYVNESIEKAKLMGIEAVSNKLPQIFRNVTDLKGKGQQIVFFCARGGMRSGSICALFNSLAIEAYKLSGGYKGYRAFINDNLPELNRDIKYIVIHGKTGTGKTEILHRLEERGCDILDLEQAANHRGSLLGSVGLGKPRSQKAFETAIYESLKQRKSNLVFVEGESKRIGNVIIPEFIAKSMEMGTHVCVEGSLDYRKSIIIKEYTEFNKSKEELLCSLDKLKRYMKDERIEGYKSSVNSECYDEVAMDLMVKYYDPMYMNEINKYKYELILNEDDINKNADILEVWYKSISIGGGQLYE